MQSPSLPGGTAYEVVGVQRFTLPVRDLAKSELFYTAVLGGEVLQRNAIELGAWETPAVRVEMSPGVEMVLAEQGHGWNAIDSTNPHWAFAIAGSDVDTWVQHLNEWCIPNAYVFRDPAAAEAGGPSCVELHFVDPDGNQFELLATDYRGAARPTGPGRYDPWPLSYTHGSWPPTVQCGSEGAARA